MINPPVSLFTSIARLDRLFAISIGPGDAGIERALPQLYAQLANLYRASDRCRSTRTFLFAAAAAVLKTDAEFSAAIALTFRLDLVNMFFAGDLYARTGVVVDPQPSAQGRRFARARPRASCASKPFSEYFSRVFAPYYLKHRPNSTGESLIADNRLDIIGDALRTNPDYYAQTNSDDLILDKPELAWLEDHARHDASRCTTTAAISATWVIAARSPTCSTCWRAAGRGARHETAVGSRPWRSASAAALRQAVSIRTACRRRLRRPTLRAAAEKCGGPGRRASSRGRPAANAAARQQAPPVTAADAPSMRTYDPWERFNRFTYRFNARFDEAIFLPVANGYRRLPSPLRAGVHNFFGNLAEVDSVINYTLQGRLRPACAAWGAS